MNQLKKVVIGVALGLTAQVSFADDYTYLFDPAIMTVGQTLGEYLVVKEECSKGGLTCTDAEKRKYVTAVDGRIGKLEIPVSAGKDFEISFNLRGFDPGLVIILYLSDGSPLLVYFKSNISYVGDVNGSSLPHGGFSLNNWVSSGMEINDFRLISEQGSLKVSVNSVPTNANVSLSGTINRIVLSKIDREMLFEIRTRGIQKSSSVSCPTTTPTTGNCTAKYTSDGKVSIPCIEVPVGFSTQVYSVEMQQRTGSFTFDLNMGSVKPR